MPALVNAASMAADVVAAAAVGDDVGTVARLLGRRPAMVHYEGTKGSNWQLAQWEAKTGVVAFTSWLEGGRWQRVS